MSYVVELFIMFVGFFTITTTAIASFHALPKGLLEHHSVKRSLRLTSFNKFFYWGLPVFLILFVAFWGGLAMLAGAVGGMIFKKRYNKVIAAQAVTPPPIPAAV